MADSHGAASAAPLAPSVTITGGSPTRRSRRPHVVALALLVGAALLARAPAVAGGPPVRVNAVAFAMIAAALCTFLVAAGTSVSGRRAGVLITERNVMSLSRFQAAVWTVLILSGFAGIALIRLKSGGGGNALAIEIDWHLWALMGLSTASLVGTPLLLSQKMDKTPTPAAVAEAASIGGEEHGAVEATRQGTLYGNPDACDARLEDMLQGDEIGNTHYLDFAKLQMFCFTAVAAVLYVSSLLKVITGAGAAPPSALPALSDGLVAMLGISHGGYLASKSVDHTPRDRAEP